MPIGRDRVTKRSWAVWARRAGPIPLLVGALGALSLLFVGCFHLAETTRSRHEGLTPLEVPLDRLIRVRLDGDGRRVLEVTAPCTITETVTGRLLASSIARLGPRSVRAAAAGGIEIGDERFGSEDILISPGRDASIVLDNRTYRGSLRIQRVGEELVFDNHVDVESYLRGVLRGELPRCFHPESFKAQAVAARTYVLYQKQTRAGLCQAGGAAGRSFDVFDHEGSQMYIGVRGEDGIAVQAVEQTRGEVCVWNDGTGDRIFCTYYSSACGGCSQPVNNVKTNEPAIPPLSGNVLCRDCYLARFYRWGPVELSKAELTERLVAHYPSLRRLGTIVGLKPKGETPDGRIIRIQLNGANGCNETLVGEDFRLSIGGRTLKSTNFVIETHSDSFVFKNGRGYGHGIGLCQHGMETKARRGMKYREILGVYYPGAKVEKIY
ncbi:MAG: SpoIID/LytB domain-containing protein [Phycisphaerae bacterium]|nr:SpoIID/LytB domain-containing protein [Phycisphaerae bacterium]